MSRHMDLLEDLRVLRRRLSRALRPSPAAGTAAPSADGRAVEEVAAVVDVLLEDRVEVDQGAHLCSRHGAWT